MRIYQLPSHIANQIAAGEVIERPASVVKELLENSLDAKATKISIEIGFGGLNQIKISDNGVGIFAEDLPLAILAHATSKITELQDLYNITSMGFRGEALASIASIARITITSRPQSQKHAMKLTVNELGHSLSPAARNVGTTIEVEDIFFNAPVRKKFLKTERGEFQLIEDVVKRFSLSAPMVSISLMHNGKLVLNLLASECDLSESLRVKKIFGTKFIENSIKIDEQKAGISLFGLLGDTKLQRSQRDKQWIYVNNRMVKDKLLAHAITQSYQDFIQPGRFPVCLLYLNIPTNDVDVNVHPTKHELRFQHGRIVHDFLVSAITSKLIRDDFSENIEHTLSEERGFEGTCEDKPSYYINSLKNANLTASIQDEWFILNASFAVIVLKSAPYLVNLVALSRQYYLDILKATSLPLLSRPLLVPVNYEINSKLEPFFLTFQQEFGNFGIQFDFIGENRILIRTIPVCLPFLDIKLLLSKLTLKVFTAFNLTSLLVDSLVFDANNITKDEQLALLEYLSKNELSSNFCVQMDDSRCLSIFKNV